KRSLQVPGQSAGTPSSSPPSGSASAAAEGAAAASSSNTSVSSSGSMEAGSDFDDIAELGAGSSGVVQRVLHRPTRQAMARKLIHLEIKPSVRAQIIRELEVLHSCNSPYIIGYFGAYFVDSSATICICMEYMNAGSLDLVLTKAGRLPEPIVAKISCSVLKGLIYLRENINCLHRRLQTVDFGVSGQLIDSLANSFVGTRSLYGRRNDSMAKSTQVLSDVWSIAPKAWSSWPLRRYPIPQPDSRDYTSAFSSDRQRNLAQHREAPVKGTRLR
uniref:mitogen-activated protein kinase kinase n=1 Tax=Macrostomum lignano TaxID=282301 RepID=A0A1I8FMH5_9PLAT